MIRAVVFDLDGTLANTANLHDGRRVPYDVLRLAPPGGSTGRLQFGDDRELLPGLLVSEGYRVGVVTNSPLAYSSTLLDLLNVDFERLLAGNSNGFKNKEEKLRSLAKYWDIQEEEILYVGDREDDEQQAQDAGCEFLHADRILTLQNSTIIDRIDTSINFDDLVNETFQDRSIHCLSCQSDQPRNVVLSPRSNGRCLDCNGYFDRKNLRSPSFHGTWSDWNEKWFDLFVAEALPTKLAKLEAKPGTQDRLLLQYEILYNLPTKAMKCLIHFDINEGIFQFPPWLVTKSELRQNEELLSATLQAAGRLFPEHSDPRNGDSRYTVPYADIFGHDLYKRLKDFTNRGDKRRPEPCLSLGFLPALIMAGHIHIDCWYLSETEWEYEPDMYSCIFALPAHPLSNDFPAQFSLRLGHRISRFLGLQCIDIFKRGSGGSGIELSSHRPVIETMFGEEPVKSLGDVAIFDAYLIDDQYTWGNTMKQAEELLLGSVFEWADYPGRHFEKKTWSKSLSGSAHENADCTSCSDDLINTGWGLMNDCLMPDSLLRILKRDCIYTEHKRDLHLLQDASEPPQTLDVGFDVHDVKDVLKNAPLPKTLLTHNEEIKGQRQKNSPHESDRAGVSWRDDEDQYLKKLTYLGVPVGIISGILQRSEGAILGRISKVLNSSARETYWLTFQPPDYSPHLGEDPDEVKEEKDYWSNYSASQNKYRNYSLESSKILERYPLPNLTRHSSVREKTLPAGLKRRGVKWRRKEINYFDALILAGASLQAISEILERSLDAIKWRAELQFDDVDVNEFRSYWIEDE